MNTTSRNDLQPDAAPEKVLGDFIDQTLAAQESPAAARRKLPWYRQAFQADYLDLYLHRDLAEAARAVRFLARALELAPSHRLLDLCCGPGRHLVFLGGCVKEAVGLDLSRVLLTRAKEHWEVAAEECGMSNVQGQRSNVEEPAEYPEDKQAFIPHSAFRIPHSMVPQLIQADMRTLPLADGRFDRVVNLFTSFGYFEREDDNARVLREIARLLRPGGLLALDHINREAMLAHLKPQTERVLPDGRHLLEKRRFDEATQRVIKDVTCREPGGQVRAWCESVRVYRPEDLEALMSAAGLAPQTRYGDYDGGPWRPDAPRLLIVARRE
jgi:SAM-dependent methyltransferase